MLNLKKAAAEQLFVELHRETKNEVLLDFKKELEQAKVTVRLSQLDYQFRINFYMNSAGSTDSKSLLNKYNNEIKCQPVLSALYLTDSTIKEVNGELLQPIIKTLMIREALPKLIEFEYEVQNTQDERESLNYLIETVKVLVESESMEELSLFDQQTSLKSSKNTSNPEKVWLSMLYQLPGMGVEKAETIAKAYPTV